MASLEVRLISQLISTGDYKAILDSGVTADDFRTEEAKDWFSYIVDTAAHRDTWGEVPSLPRFKARFPTFQADSSGKDSVTTLCKDLLDWNTKIEGELAGEDIIELLSEGALEDALMVAQRWAETWTRRRATISDHSFTTSARGLLSDYDQVANADGLLGLPWPWHNVNEETLGMQPGQLFVFYARPKNMKTWVALYVAAYLYLFHGVRVLFYSREMDPKQVLRRLSSIIAGLDYAAIKKGRLTPTQREAYEDAILAMADHEEEKKSPAGRRPCFIVSNDRGRNAKATIQNLHQKCQDESIEFVVCDAIYKMKGGGASHDLDWRSQASVLQQFKDMLVDLRIPGIATTQAKRGAAKKASEVSTEGAAYTDASGQECDLMFRLIMNKKAEDTGIPEILIVSPAGRDEDIAPFVINALPGSNFTLKRRHLSEDDVKARVAADNKSGPDDEEKNEAKPARRRGTSRARAGLRPQR